MSVVLQPEEFDHIVYRGIHMWGGLTPSSADSWTGCKTTDITYITDATTGPAGKENTMIIDLNADRLPSLLDGCLAAAADLSPPMVYMAETTYLDLLAQARRLSHALPVIRVDAAGQILIDDRPFDPPVRLRSAVLSAAVALRERTGMADYSDSGVAALKKVQRGLRCLQAAGYLHGWEVRSSGGWVRIRPVEISRN